jgi:high-affinity nickel permease
MASTAELERKLDQLQGELEARQSTTFFAHAAVTLLTALMLGGAAAKMLVDATESLERIGGTVIASVAGLLVVYAVISYFRGRGALRRELHRLEELKSVRRELRLDDPAALLPSR